MNLVTKDNFLEKVQALNPGETLYLKVPTEVASGLNLSLDMLISIQHLFKTAIEVNDQNHEIVKGILVDYKDCLATYFSTICEYTLSVGGEEAILYCENPRNRIAFDYNKTLGLIEYRRLDSNSCGLH